MNGVLQRRGYAPFALLAIIWLLVSLAGFLAFHYQMQSIKQGNENNLASIASLKSKQISTWLQDCKSDAYILSERTHIAVALDEWLHGGLPDAANQRWLLSRLKIMQHNQDYAAVALLDLDGQVRISTDSSAIDKPDERLRQVAMKAMQSGRVNLSDLHLGNKQKPEIDMVAPLITGEDGARRAPLPHRSGEFPLSIGQFLAGSQRKRGNPTGASGW